MDDFITFLNNKLKNIKKYNKKFYTNCFKIIDTEDIILDVFESKQSITFVINDNGVYRIYFYSVDLNDLKLLLIKYPSNYSIEYLSKTYIKEIEDIFLSSGFSKHAVFNRYSNIELSSSFCEKLPKVLLNIKIDKYYSLEKVANANLVYTKLCEVFDRYNSHIKNITNIENMIENKNVFVNYKNKELLAIMTYLVEGRKLYIEHLYNSGRAEIAFSMFYKSILIAINKGINYAYTWVDEKNEAIISFIEKFSFKFDGLCNYIYVKR